jgi:hypothetical protein
MQLIQDRSQHQDLILWCIVLLVKYKIGRPNQMWSLARLSEKVVTACVGIPSSSGGTPGILKLDSIQFISIDDYLVKVSKARFHRDNTITHSISQDVSPTVCSAAVVSMYHNTQVRSYYIQQHILCSSTQMQLHFTAVWDINELP